MYAINSLELSLIIFNEPNRDARINKRKNDTIKVIKDNAQAGIPAKYNFFVFFPIIVNFMIFYSYVA